MSCEDVVEAEYSRQLQIMSAGAALHEGGVRERVKEGRTTCELGWIRAILTQAFVVYLQAARLSLTSLSSRFKLRGLE